MRARLVVAMCLALSGLLAIPTANAQDKDSRTKCIDPNGSNDQWRDCGEKELARQNVRLNSLWKKAVKCMDDSESDGDGGWKPIAKKKLLDEQRLWANYNKGACRVFTDTGFFSSEIGVTVGLSCQIKIVRDRADWLEQFVLGRTCRGD